MYGRQVNGKGNKVIIITGKLYRNKQSAGSRAISARAQQSGQTFTIMG